MAGYENFSSSIKHILIPIPGFENYHQTGTESIEDKKFIGRKAIIAKLTSWIANDKTLTGAYLITGYRGMGKSSFVGKVLYDLSNRPTQIPATIHVIAKLILIALAAYISYAGTRDTDIKTAWIAAGVLAFIGLLTGLKAVDAPQGDAQPPLAD